MTDAHQDLTGRTIVVTGASDGIGAEAAQVLHRRGATVIVTGRSAIKLQSIAEAVGSDPLVADFANFADVRRLAGEIAERAPRIDVLMNNAGGTFEPTRTTADGHEPNIQINHLAPFLLTHLLHPCLAAADGSLVLNTSSVANNIGRVDLADLDRVRRSEFVAYGTGKLMNILFTRGIAQRWGGDGIVSAAVHPGPVGTSFGRDSWFIGLLYRTPLKRIGTISVPAGAAPLVELAARGADPELNGRYYSRFTADGLESKQAKDQRYIDGLWEQSLRLTGLA